ncbi:MAG: hypothetical protein K6G30_12115 [Acetatifactor sp.]|nr:hypothetical protein [Acetatifactor sp.]
MLRKWLLVRMNDLKRMKQCIGCMRDPENCGCTEKDEDENGMCKRCLPRVKAN